MAKGEKGKVLIYTDEGKFDPRTIPRKRWEEYSNEALTFPKRHQRAESLKSTSSHGSFATRNFVPTADFRRQESVFLDQNPYFTAGSRASSFSTLPNQSQQNLLTPQNSHPRSSYFEMENIPSAPSIASPSRSFSIRSSPFPSDAQLFEEINHLLNCGNLMVMTKRDVRLELERTFGVNLESKRVFIGEQVEAILAGRS